MRARHHCGHRGFTLLEALVVFALVAVLGGAAYLTLGGSQSPTGDVTARASLTQLYNLQATRPDAPVTDPDLLAELDPTRTWTTGVSAAPDTVSVRADTEDPAVLGAAVATGGGACWLLRRDFDAPSLSAAAVWAVADGGECSAIRSLGLVPDEAGVLGQTVDRPLQL